MNGIPPVRRRLVGMALRRYRENRGFTLEDAARVLECDRSKISRIETGQRGIHARDLRDLVAEYDVGEQERAFLAAIATPKAASGWWREYEDVVAGEWRDYLIMESLATKVLTHRTQQIPSLLQTKTYATAVASASEPGARSRAVEAVLARQEAILGVKELELAVVIAEGALHQQVGGADVMRGQLAWLAELAGSSRQLTIQVLPFESGAYPDFGVGAMDIMTFAGTPGPGLVRIPGISGGIYLEDAEDVTRYASAFTRIRNAALSASASAAMLRLIADASASTGEAPRGAAELLLCPGCCTIDHIFAYQCDPEAIAPQAGCTRCSFTFPLLPAEFALVTLEAIRRA